MALPNEWWKQADLAAGGTGLDNFIFPETMFDYRPGGVQTIGDSEQQVEYDPSLWWSGQGPVPSQGTSQPFLKADGSYGMLVKSGEKQGSIYDLLKTDGGYKPVYVGDQAWDTNSGSLNKAGLIALATLLSAGAASGAFGAAGAGGMAAGEGAMIGPGLTSVGDLVGAAGAAGAAGSGFTMPSLGQIYNGAKTGIGALGVGNTLSSLTTGKPLVGSGGHVYDPTGGRNVPTITSPGNPAQPGQQPGQSGLSLGDVFNFLTNAGLTAYGQNERKDAAQRLEDLYKEQMAMAKPYEERLRTSYEDPQSVFTSPEFTSGRDLYKVGIDRQASKAGSLTNPIERQVLLDKFGANYMNQHRAGLSGTLSKMMENASNYRELMALGLMGQASDASTWQNMLSRQFGDSRGNIDFNKVLGSADKVVTAGGNLLDWWNSLGGPQGGNEDKGGDVIGGGVANDPSEDRNLDDFFRQFPDIGFNDPGFQGYYDDWYGGIEGEG